MTEIQYGVRYVGTTGNADEWDFTNEQQAREYAAKGGPRRLIAREIGEPYEVKELPTTPGSVILATPSGSDGTPRHLMRCVHSVWDWDWIGASDLGSGRASNAWPSSGILPDWTLVFDAGAES